MELQAQTNRPKQYIPQGGILLPNDNFIPGGLPYAANIANIIRSQLNRVKHTAESFARLHGLDPNYLESVMTGNQPLTPEIVYAIENHPPLSVRELIHPSHKHLVKLLDESIDGVIITTAKKMAETKRDIYRGQEGRESKFYTYADPAMQRYSHILPEWIKELYVHDGVDPEDVPDWAFNKGHRERQVTIFFGSVNFHWKDKDDRKHVIQTYTGDADYITPFVPHTFTTREEGKGLILAITDLGAIGTEEFQQKIQGITLQDYQIMVQRKLSKLADNLPTDQLKGIVFRRYKDSSTTHQGSYVVKTLMDGIPYQPNSKATEIIIKQSQEPKKLDIGSPTDKWGYNIGDAPVVLWWGNHQQELGLGDSFSIQPNVPFALRAKDGLEGRLVMMEVNPEEENPMDLIAMIKRYAGEIAVNRVHSEFTQWF